VLQLAYDLSRGLQDRSARARASCALALAVSRGGELAHAESLIQESLRELPNEEQFALDRVFCLLRGSEVSGDNGDAKTLVARAELAQDALKNAASQSANLKLRVLTHLAEAYGFAGRTREALATFRQASVELTNLGYDQTKTAVGLFTSWGHILMLTGREYEAEKIYRRAIDISLADQTGEAATPLLLDNYADTLRRLGRLDEAAAYAERAYVKARQVNDQLGVGAVLMEQARVECDRGDFRRVTTTLAEAEPLVRRQLPAGHYAFASLASQRSLMAQEKGDLAAAMRLADEALAIDQAAIKARREGGFLLPTLLVRRSNIELEAGKVDDAALDASRALDLLQRAREPETFSSFLGEAHLALGRALQAQGKNDEALANFRLAAEHLENSLGNDHAESRAARTLAAQLLGGGSALNY
jgi:tetratricopeptide (TPR) repeat protein